jgi:hypothetical protein
MTAPRSAVAPRLGGRALLTDPALLAAVDWEGAPGLRAAALAEAERWPGVGGFGQALVVAAATLPQGGAIGRLRVTADTTPATAMSLFAFRRLPWPVTLAEVDVRAPAAAKVKIPPASALRTSSPAAFPADCFARP